MEIILSSQPVGFWHGLNTLLMLLEEFSLRSTVIVRLGPDRRRTSASGCSPEVVNPFHFATIDKEPASGQGYR
jgi:hypothetical protein